MARWFERLLSRPSPEEKGTVVEVKFEGMVATVSGLPTSRMGELLQFASGPLGQVVALLEHEVVVSPLGSQEEAKRISTGEDVVRTGRTPRVAGAPGQLCWPPPEDPDAEQAAMPLATAPPSFAAEQRLGRRLCFETGVKALDILLPMQPGEVRLLLGPVGSGKTTLATQIMRHRAFLGQPVVYAGIGTRPGELDEVRDRLGKAAASVLFLGSPASHTYGDRALALRASFELAARARDQGGQCLLVLDSVNRALESLARRNGMAGLFSTVPLAIDELGAACQHARDLEAGGSLTVLLLTETPLGRTPRRDPLFRALGVLPGRGEFNPVLSRSMRLEGTWPPIDFAASVPLGWGSYVFRPHLGGYGFKLLAYYAHYQAQVLNRGGSACLDYPLPANGDEWYERLSALVAQDSTKGIALGKQVALFAAFHYGELGDVPVHLLEELERALHERLNDTPEFVERLTLGCAGDKRNELAREVRAVVAALLEP